jgi:hypothetical protein
MTSPIFRSPTAFNGNPTNGFSSPTTHYSPPPSFGMAMSNNPSSGVRMNPKVSSLEAKIHATYASERNEVYSPSSQGQFDYFQNGKTGSMRTAKTPMMKGVEYNNSEEDLLF